MRSFASALWLALGLVILAPALSPHLVSAQAQTAQPAAQAPVDYAAWEQTASIAETVISEDQATIERLEALRSEIVNWRAQFLSQQSVNSARITLLRDQIAALGPVPEDGTGEPEDIASRRADLTEQLNTALAPVRRAEEAFARADGLIRELDRLVRERQTDRTLRLDPSPLLPANWPAATIALWDTARLVQAELQRNLDSSLRMRAFRDNLPLVAILGLIGLLLVVRAPVWIERGLARLRARVTETRAGLRLVAFAASLLGVFLPFAGLAMLLQAVENTLLLGPLGEFLTSNLLRVVAMTFIARWLARQIFPKAYPPRPIVTLPDRAMGEARFYTTLLGFLAAMDLFVRDLADFALVSGDWTAAVQGVVRLPILVLAGLMLFRFGQLLLGAARASTADSSIDLADDSIGSDAPGRLILTTGARVAMLAGLLGPILAAIGYVTAGGVLVISTTLSLALFAVVAVLQRLVRDIYAAFLGEDAVGSALIPVLLAFALSVGALPMLALIWGARPSDLWEVWAMISTGVSLGETRITPGAFFAAVVIFAIGYALTRLLQGALRSQVLPKTSLDTGGRNAVVAGTGYIGIFLAALMAITGAGLDLSSLAIVAGALSVGIGFGLQTIVSNFVSGIILLIERPISEGDWIEVGSTMGVVKDISVRATRVETFDRRDVIVPNADLISTSVTNWTKNNLTGRLIIPVGVAYGTDTRRVEALLRKVVEDHPVVVINPPPAVVFMNFGADSLEFEIRAILRDVNYLLSARSDINHEIARVFMEEGIEIPFAQRDVWLRNPETLKSEA